MKFKIQNVKCKMMQIKSRILNFKFLILNSKGFTLVELLISVSIFTLITAMVVVNFRAGAEQSDLRRAAQAVAGNIRELQTMAQTGRQVDLCPTSRTDELGEVVECGAGTDGGTFCETGDTCGCGECRAQVPNGYGLYAAPDTLTVFVDGNGNGLFDSGEQWDELRAELPQSAYISATSENSGLNLVFTPPFGQIRVNGASNASAPSEAAITVTHRQSGDRRTVRIFRASGRVESD